MTRKEFLQTIGGIAATSIAASGPFVPRAAAAPAPNNIMRGVTFYSFQEELYTRKMTLEDCVSIAHEFGADGLEVLGDAVIPGYPRLSNTFLKQWYSWMDKYGTTPVCHDMFLDIRINNLRTMSIDEEVDYLVRDIIYARKLKCRLIRCIAITPPQVMEKALPYAEKFGVKLALEVHSPWNFESDPVQRYLEVMNRMNSPYLGLCPDCGIFFKKFPRVVAERALRNGAQEKCVRYICECFDKHLDLGKGIKTIEDFTRPIGNQNKILETLKSMGANPADMAFFGISRAYTWNDPKCLLEFMPYIFHIHAKFLEMQEDYTEYSIPFDEIVKVLIEGKYEGYLSSEYEGGMHIQDKFEVDGVEQVRRQQVMLKRLLGK
jgi:sugar phosphate isomerase/epimerase